MQIDPNLMNDELKKDGKENRYQKKQQIEPTIEAEAPSQKEYENPKHEQNEEILPGLYQSDITSWKKQFGEIYMADVKGNVFVFRALERFEYKEILGVPNTDPLMREEMICEYCVLYPQGYDFSVIANQKAGLPAVVAEMIMDHSGFTRDVQVRKL